MALVPVVGELVAVADRAFAIVGAIRGWWRGKITGKECAKKICVSAFTAGFGSAGGRLSSWLFDTMFGKPYSKAVVNAHAALGVRPSNSMTTIDSVYRQRMRTHHPDRGGNVEEYYKVRSAYETIVNARR